MVLGCMHDGDYFTQNNMQLTTAIVWCAIPNITSVIQQHIHPTPPPTTYLKGNSRKPAQAHKLTQIHQHCHCTRHKQPHKCWYRVIIVCHPGTKQYAIQQGSNEDEGKALGGGRSCQKFMTGHFVFLLHCAAEDLLHATGDHTDGCNDETKEVSVLNLGDSTVQWGVWRCEMGCVKMWGSMYM